jgi:ribonuclease J
VSGEILLIEDGQPIEFTEDAAYRREPVTAGRVCVDSGSLEEIEEVVIRDRQHLSEDGVVVPIIAIDKHTGRKSNPSRKSSRADSCRRTTARNCWRRARSHSAHRRAIQPEEKTDWSVIKEKIRVDLRRYFKKQTSKRPLILPVILEL